MSSLMLLVPSPTLPLALLGQPIWPQVPKSRARRRVANDKAEPVGPRWSLGLCARTLGCWTQALCPEGELVIAEPKTLRYRPWRTAGRLVRHGRQLVLCLQGT
jgi:hypothetical protein